MTMISPQMSPPPVIIDAEGVLDEYLRRKLKDFKRYRGGVNEFAQRIGTKPQGVHAIIAGQKGRRFTFEHLCKFAKNSDIAANVLFKELADLAFEMEQQSDDRNKPTETILEEAFSQDPDAVLAWLHSKLKSK